MIKDSAKKLLNLLKTGSGYPGKFSEYHDADIGKIIEVIANECKATVIDKDGNKHRYESDLPLDVVRQAVEQLLSANNVIKANTSAIVMQDEEILGLATDINISKGVDSNGKLVLSIEKPFPENFNSILMGGDTQDKFKDMVLKPYLSRLCKKTPKLENKYFFSRVFNPFHRKDFSDKELQENYTKYLQENTDLNENEINNMSIYLIYNVLGNKGIQETLVQDQLQGVKMIKSSDKGKSGYSQMLEDMSYDLLDILNIIKNPNEKLDELQKIFANAEEQLEALGMEMPNEPEQIEEAIKALNRPVVSKENEKYFGENGYRNVNVGLGNRDVGFLRKEQVPQAMKLYSQSISDFVQSSDELTDEEYVSKVARLQFRFTRIHPFPDGNGRTARAISNILLLRRNLCAVFDKRTKQEYSKQISGIFNDYEEYNEALCTNQSACDKIESQNIYRLEEYIGINCLNRTDLFEDRNITSELSEVKQYGQFR